MLLGEIYQYNLLLQAIGAELKALGVDGQETVWRDERGGKTVIRPRLIGMPEIVYRSKESLLEYGLGREELEALCDRLAGEIGRQKNSIIRHEAVAGIFSLSVFARGGAGNGG